MASFFRESKQLSCNSMMKQCPYCRQTNAKWKHLQSFRMHKFHCSRTFTVTHLTPHSEDPPAADSIEALGDMDLINTIPPMATVPPDDQDPPMPDIPLTSARRPRRLQWRLPARYRDDPPPCPPTLPTGIPEISAPPPTHDPDATTSLQDLWDRELGESGTNEDEPPPGPDAPVEEPGKSKLWSPFPNTTIAHLMCWFHTGSAQKSNAELDTLVKMVLLRDDFSTQDLRGFSTKAEHNCLDDAVNAKIDPMNRLFPLHAGWE
ncbi:hypothetical protein BDN71DRAFT_1508017 [Pleurotus eryngii]|uniref:Uncharacterized protein n=1 Tax=Pleurotus eryngii TaxID=5323 RepID=A0A9P5ZUC0_PLEER|nr:hypothetical protein BDN71DRAFT_1508017 [Pleurotus eryngii]